jgi:hypothetical protein
MKKVIIWGHKLHSHTHSYIHNSYYNTFKALGFDTYWFDNWDNVSGFDFENCIFFTEDQVHQNIPLNKSSFYILHHCNLSKYINGGCRFINLCNYVDDCRQGLSRNYPDSSVEKLTYYSYYDDKNKALYQPWGTDLLPDEFGEPILYDNNNKNVYYIGSVWSDNIDLIKPFAKACEDHGKPFVNKRFISDEEGMELVKQSYISPDIRTQLHVDVGYIPCRVLKNISYGTIPATHSKFIRDFFGDNILPYSDNTYDLFEVNENFIKEDKNIELCKWLMSEVKEHHTYITRVKTLLKFL